MLALPILVGISMALLCCAAVHDVAFRTIPNWLSATIFVLGGSFRVLDGSVLAGLLAVSLIFAGSLLLWHRGWLGGGDVKLLTACGFLVPPTLAVAMLLDTALAGGLLALLYLALGRVLAAPPVIRPVGLMSRVVRVERRRIARRGPLPYGSAIAAGALIVLLKDY